MQIYQVDHKQIIEKQIDDLSAYDSTSRQGRILGMIAMAYSLERITEEEKDELTGHLRRRAAEIRRGRGYEVN